MGHDGGIRKEPGELANPYFVMRDALLLCGMLYPETCKIKHKPPGCSMLLVARAAGAVNQSLPKLYLELAAAYMKNPAGLPAGLVDRSTTAADLLINPFAHARLLTRQRIVDRRIRRPAQVFGTKASTHANPASLGHAIFRRGDGIAARGQLRHEEGSL